MLKLKAKYNTAENHERGAYIDILDPESGLPSGFIIKIRGIDSKTYQNAQQLITQKRISNRAMKMDIAEIEAENLDMLASCVIGWEGSEHIDEDDEPIQFSKEHVIELFTRRPAIRRQVDEAMTEDHRFLPKS